MTETATLRSALVGLSTKDQARTIHAIANALCARLAADGADTTDAVKAIELIDRWFAGDRVSGAEFSDAVYTEMGRGLLAHVTDTGDPATSDLWNALTTAIMYVARLVYAETGERMPEDVSEVDEETLDLLDSQWKNTSAYDASLIHDKDG